MSNKRNHRRRGNRRHEETRKPPKITSSMLAKSAEIAADRLRPKYKKDHWRLRLHRWNRFCRKYSPPAFRVSLTTGAIKYGPRVTKRQRKRDRRKGHGLLS